MDRGIARKRKEIRGRGRENEFNRETRNQQDKPFYHMNLTRPESKGEEGVVRKSKA